MRTSWFCLSSGSLLLWILSGAALSVQAAQLTGDRQQPLNRSPDQAIRIDFEDFAAGTYLEGNEWSAMGVTLSVQSHRQRRDGTGNLPLRLFNSRPLAN